MVICKDVVCLVRRILSEYGMMFYKRMSSPQLPCRWSILKSNQEEGCKYCFLMDKKILENILICIVPQYLEDEYAEQKSLIIKSLNLCEKSEKIKGIGEIYPAYWSITDLDGLELYNEPCKHDLDSEAENSIDPHILWFLLATVIDHLPDLGEMVNLVFSLFCPHKKEDGGGFFLTNDDDCNLLRDYCEKVKDKDFFHVTTNDLGKELQLIFSHLSKYLEERSNIFPSGLEHQLIEYLKSINGETKSYNDISHGAA